MIGSPRRNRWLRAKRGTATLEFAIVATVMLPVVFAIIEAGLILWTLGGLQIVAGLTARCAAIADPSCPAGQASPYAQTQAYAVSTAASWIMSGVIQAQNVTVASQTTCGGVSGKFQVVTITCPFFAGGWLPPPFSDKTLTVSSCFPSV